MWYIYDVVEERNVNLYNWNWKALRGVEHLGEICVKCVNIRL